MTDVALIAPVDLLHTQYGQRYQLLLPHMMENDHYRLNYMKFLASSEYWVIMDNGAAEDVLTTDEALFHYAMEWVPGEVAAPDILTNRTETVERAIGFAKKYGQGMQDAGISLGYVAQGFDVEDAFNGVCQAMQQHFFDVIYLPRLLVKAHDKSARLRLADMVFNEFEEAVDIHFFGASVHWPREVQFTVDKHYIRSIDTSMPYNYAYNVRSFYAKGEVSRPKDFFDLPASDFPSVTTRIAEYLSWTK